MTRLNLDLSSDALGLIDSMCKDTDLSRAELFNNALSLFEKVIKEAKAGNRLAVVSSDKDCTFIVIKPVQQLLPQ